MENGKLTKAVTCLYEIITMQQKIIGEVMAQCIKASLGGTGKIDADELMDAMFKDELEYERKLQKIRGTVDQLWKESGLGERQKGQVNNA